MPMQQCTWCASDVLVALLPAACSQLYGMYVGEGEAVLRDTFRRARMACPAIIFLDEADALAPRRQEGSGDQGSAGGPDAGLRLLSTLLTEIDGLEETQGVCVGGGGGGGVWLFACELQLQHDCLLSRALMFSHPRGWCLGPDRCLSVVDCTHKQCMPTVLYSTCCWAHEAAQPPLDTSSFFTDRSKWTNRAVIQL